MINQFKDLWTPNPNEMLQNNRILGHSCEGDDLSSFWDLAIEVRSLNAKQYIDLSVWPSSQLPAKPLREIPTTSSSSWSEATAAESAINGTATKLLVNPLINENLAAWLVSTVFFLQPSNLPPQANWSYGSQHRWFHHVWPAERDTLKTMDLTIVAIVCLLLLLSLRQLMVKAENVLFQHMQRCHSFVIWGFEMLLQKFGAAWEPHGEMKSLLQASKKEEISQSNHMIWKQVLDL